MEVVIKRNELVVREFLFGLVVSSFVGYMYSDFLNIYTLKSVPKIDGTIKLEDLQRAVTIKRDSKGVPHIKAENAHDLYFSQGYVQAQDRLFQMDLSRRQASGRLSEVVGKQLLIEISCFERSVYGEQPKRLLVNMMEKRNMLCSHLLMG